MNLCGVVDEGRIGMSGKTLKASVVQLGNCLFLVAPYLLIDSKGLLFEDGVSFLILLLFEVFVIDLLKGLHAGPYSWSISDH